MSDAASLLADGIARQRAGQHEAAIRLFQQALQSGGGSAALYCRLAESYEQLRDLQRADDAYVAAIEREPDASEAYLRASDLARRSSALAARVGQGATARALRDAALQYLNALGVRLVRRRVWSEAEAVFRRAQSIKPEDWAVNVDLGHCLYQMQRHREAEESIRDGIRRAPQQPLAHYHLGVTLLRQGRASEAEDALRRSIALDASYEPARAALADALFAQGRVADPETSRRETSSAEPALERSLFLMGPIYAEGTPEAICARHRTWGEQAIAAAQADAADGAPFANTREPGRRLRVGYVSQDFVTHSVAYFLEPLLASHDRAAVEIFCYADVAQPDATTARLQALSAQWRPITALDDAAVRRQIREDRIDILIDLAGHTRGSRLDAFLVRPAPVTASWLGYPATTGLATIDWRITDAVADPPGAEAHHLERLMRVDGCFLAFRPPEDAPEVAPLPAAATGHVTFGSFNNLLKLSDVTVAAWAELLAAMPDSRLLLKALLLRDAAAQRRVRERFAEHGIAPERLELRGATNDRASHLAAYGEIDIALDSFPYNGTATTCEALWMGVPVATWAGDRHSARVGHSLLGHAGLGELVRRDRRGYVDCALGLARDLSGLAGLRAGLRPRIAASPLCDGPGFARAFETALRRMWTDWSQG